VANFLQLTYEDVLLNPTFNNYPTHPTTMQDMDSIALDEDQRVFIEQTADEDYQTVLREVVVL
jgi:hypothetical protein